MLKLFECKKCKEIERAWDAQVSELSKKIKILTKENDDKISRIKRLKEKLKPYIEPRTKMLYKIKVDKTTYEVIADSYYFYGHIARNNTEFFLGDKRVADFSRVDEIIGFEYEDWQRDQPKKELVAKKELVE